MSKRVLIVSSSLRAGSNSERMAQEVLRGALDAGCDAELVSLKGKDLRFCRGCLACQETGACAIRDDMDEMLGKVGNAETIVFATPIYYYCLSGQLKVLLDRCNPLYGSDYKFTDIYLVTASADDGDDVSDRAVTALDGWIACFPRARFAGELSAGGLDDAGEADGREAVLEEAYELGKSLGA